MLIMTIEMLIGIILLILTMGFSVYLLLFSRSIINRIEREKLSHLHDIMREIYGRKSS